MGRRTVLTIVVLALLVMSASIAAQEPSRQVELKEGIELFRQGLYSHAILIMRNIVLDPAESTTKGSAYFWLSKSYLATSNLDDAERSLEFYLNNYPDDADYAEGVYQKGRLLYKQAEYESAIQILQSFITRYPQSPFGPNAYFWIGESLYSLGQLTDSLAVFRKVIQDYPKSYKIEAARYRVSLIEFKKRENELLKLLKWSHEESLKTVETFQLRERTYEQAIAAYQKRIAEYEQMDYHEMTDSLKADAAEQDATVASLRETIVAHEQTISDLRDQTASPTATAGAPTAAQVTAEADQTAAKLLQIKAEALEIKEALLEWMLTSAQAE